MKKAKRVWAFLVAAVMLLSMLPAGVLATDSVVNEETMEESKLFFRFCGWDNDNMIVEEELTTTMMGIPINSSVTGCLYYGTETEAERVLAEDLEVTDKVLELELRKEKELADTSLYGYVVRIQTLAFGTGTVSYKGSEVTLEVGLPNFGLYTTTTATVESFLYQTVSLGSEEPMYFCLSPYMKESGYTFYSVAEAPDWATVTIAEDGSYAMLEAGEEAAGETWCNIGFNLKNASGNISFWNEGFEVVDNRPGLRWCRLEKDADGERYADTENLRNAVDVEIGTGSSAAICYVEGKEITLLELEELKFPGFMEAEIYDEELPSTYLYLNFDDFGSDYITYTRDGVDYKLPVTVSLPMVGYFASPFYSEKAYIGQTLSFDGKNEAGEKVDSETFYLVAEDGWKITEVSPKSEGMEFYAWELAEDGSYAVVTISDGFSEQENYEVRVYLESDSGDTTKEWAEFEIENHRPSLKWCWVEWDDSDNMYADTRKLRNVMEQDVGTSSRMAVCFVDGDQITLLEPDDLIWPDFMEIEPADRNQPETFMRLSFNDFGSGYITYDLEDVTYKLPVNVTLPQVGYYTQPVRSEETYAGRVLTFDGKDEDGAPVTSETFYVMAEDEWSVTELEPETNGMEFFHWEIPSGKPYAVVTIDEGFSDSYYDVKAYLEDDTGDTDWTWADFEVKDVRPGLRYKYVEHKNDQYVIEEELNSTFDGAIGNGYWVAFYYVEAGVETEIPMSELNFPNVVEAELLDQGNKYYTRVNLEKFGTGEITCDAYPGCKIPVSVGLPRAGFYSENKRTEEHYLNESLPFTGKTTDNDGEAFETFYILPEGDWTFTSLTKDPDGDGYDMDFMEYSIAEDGTYIEVTIKEGFEDRQYHLEVFLERDGGNGTGNRHLWFRVEDSRPGLKWCWVEWDDDDNMYADTRDLRSMMERDVDTSSHMAIAFVDGDEITLLEPDDLNWPDFMEIEAADENESKNFMRLSFNDFGSGFITYTLNGVTYKMPVEVMLPQVGYYTRPVRSEEAYAGRTLTFDGKDENGNNVTAETFYLLAEERCTITELELCTEGMEFYSWEIPEDKNYAVVTINEGFTDRNYEVKAYFKDANGSGWNWADFRIEDNRPGLRWCWIEWDDEDNMYADTHEMRRVMERDVDTNSRMAIALVDGDEITLLEPDDLTWPDFMEIEPVGEDQPKSFMSLSFNDFGSGFITYTLNGVTYKMPVEVMLPQVGYYTQPVRSEETYAGRTLSFDGKDENGDHVTAETFYMLAADRWTIAGLELWSPNMGFYSWEIPEGKNYAVVTISEGFTDEYYEVMVYLKDANGSGTFWADFEVADNRPGLKWCYVPQDEGENYTPNTDAFYGNFKVEADDGASVAFFFLDEDGKQQVTAEDLTFPDFVTVEEQPNDTYWLIFKKPGTGEITYVKDGAAYTIPVTAMLPTVSYYSSDQRTEEGLLPHGISGNAGDIKTAYLLWDTVKVPVVDDVLVWHNEEWISINDANLAERGITLTRLANGVKIDAVIGKTDNLRLRVVHENGWYGRSLNIETIAAVGYTLTYVYPKELCTFTVYDFYDDDKTLIQNGGVLPINEEKNTAYGVFEVKNIAEGYRIADFLINGVSRKETMINGAYGGCAITINKDSVLTVVLEEIPEVLATIQSVVIYTGQTASETSMPAVNVVFGEDLSGLHAVVTYADGQSYPGYYASCNWEYSTDNGNTWQLVPAWGNRVDFNAAWSGFTDGVFCDPPIDFMTMENYLMRVKVATKPYYSTVGENVSEYSAVVAVNSIEEPDTLYKLKAPSGLTWGTYCFEGEDGEMQCILIPGMMSWTVTDTDYEHQYIVKVYHEDNAEEPVFENGWYYRAGRNPVLTDHDFSNRFPRESLPDGNYYFTLQAIGDGETTGNSDVVTSSTWYYKNPNVAYETPSWPEWTFPMASWSDYEFTYDEYCSGYSVEYWYSATDADATSTDELTRLGGHIWYFGEGNYNTYHVIPKAYLEKMGAGYYYFTVRSHSSDILTVSHSEKALSPACYFAGDLVTTVTNDGVLTIVDQAAANGTGWAWDGDTLTLEAVDGFAVKAVRFLPYVPEATINLKSDITLDASALKIGSYEYRPAIALEAPEGMLEISTGKYTLTVLSGGRGIYSAGSMNITDSNIDAQGEEEVILANRGDMVIRNSEISAVGGKYSWGIYVHGYRIGEEDTCYLGNLTIENSTVYASTVDEQGEGSGNAIYSDGNMLITGSEITTNGGNNGIGNDCGGVKIADSTVHSVGDYLGIFSYYTIEIENSAVTAEGIRAIEIASRTEELPKVESFVLNDCKIITPRNHQVALAGVSYPWSDTVVSVIHDVDATEGEDWQPATLVKILPAGAEGEEPEVNNEILNLIPEGKDETIEVETVQAALAEKKEEIKQALNDELAGQTSGTTALVEELEKAINVEVSVKAEEDAPFVEAAVVGAALNAKAEEEKVELVIAPVVAEELDIPEQFTDLGTDIVPFSMKLEGAVDADEETEGHQLVVPVQIRLPIPESFDPHLTVLLHFLQNGEVEVIDAKVSDGYITFVTDGFSDYALANMATATVTDQGVDVKIAGANANTVMAAAYDKNGQMLGISCLTNGTGKIICKSADVKDVKFFLLDENLAPITQQKSITLSK